jgi:hypothetical protein
VVNGTIADATRSYAMRVSGRIGRRTLVAGVAAGVLVVVGLVVWLAAAATSPHARTVTRSALAAQEQQRSPLEQASKICWEDSNDGLLDYTGSYGVDSLYAMEHLMINASSDLQSLAAGTPTAATHAIGEVRSALAQAAAAEDQMLAKMPPPPAVPQGLVASTARAVANLDRVTVRDNLRACEFKVSEETVDRWAKVVPPPNG